LKAQYLVEKVLYSDEETRNKIREEQSKASHEIMSEQFCGILNFFNIGPDNNIPIIEDHLLTPYGPPSKNV
jgi:hypothetical protein